LLISATLFFFSIFSHVFYTNCPFFEQDFRSSSQSVLY